MVSMLVPHHAVQLETTSYHKLCYKSSPPPPILYTYHHKIPPFQQLPKKTFLKETEKNNNKNNGKQRGKGMGEALFFSLPSV